MEFIPLISIMCIMGLIGGFIGHAKGKPGKGFLLGLFLGPIGWTLMFFDARDGLITASAIGVVGICVVEVFLRRQEYQDVREAREDGQRMMDGLPPVGARPVTYGTGQPAPASVTAYIPPPAPTPDAATIERQRALAEQQANAQRALEIARKYGAH